MEFPIPGTVSHILYAQHGWADDSRTIAALAHRLATPGTMVVAPDLGYLQTWLRIAPLIQRVEQIATEMFTRYPALPLRIVGHSMGGLIWLEVLHRHPEWWLQVESLVLIASPVGGADLGRLLDPMEWGIGIARDLGKNRRPIATAIAAVIPTLSIAGDVDNGSDGTITVSSSQFQNARFVRLPGLSHAVMRNHPRVTEEIQRFWHQPAVESRSEQLEFSDYLIQKLQSVPGITDAHPRDFKWAETYHTFDNGVTLRRWKNPLGLEHVFVGSPAGNCLYGGFVSWVHARQLQQAIAAIRDETDDLPNRRTP